MPSATHAARLGQSLGGRAITLGWTVVATILLSLVAAAISKIWLGYQDGAFNFGSYMFRATAPRYYDGIVSSIRDIGKETHYGSRMAKVIILRIGGIRLYRRGIPMMIGCVVGNTFALFISMLVDLIWFPGQGHNLFWGD